MKKFLLASWGVGLVVVFMGGLIWSSRAQEMDDQMPNRVYSAGEVSNAVSAAGEAVARAVEIAANASARPSSDVIPTKNGPIKITALFHGSVQIEYWGKVVLVDPISAASLTKKADMILITHTHPDHLDVEAISKLVKSDLQTTIFAPVGAQEQLESLAHSEDANIYLRNDDLFGNRWWRGITVEAVPAYNLKRGPKPGQKFHPKYEFNGYVLTLGGKRFYFAGDTEFIPEMKNLKNIDAAFLPMNLPYTMTPQEAANAAKSFGPRVVYPYHFRDTTLKPNNNPQQFWKALKGTKIKVRLLDWYPAAAVAKATKK